MGLVSIILKDNIYSDSINKSLRTEFDISQIPKSMLYIRNMRPEESIAYSNVLCIKIYRCLKRYKANIALIRSYGGKYSPKYRILTDGATDALKNHRFDVFDFCDYQFIFEFGGCLSYMVHIDYDIEISVELMDRLSKHPYFLDFCNIVRGGSDHNYMEVCDYLANKQIAIEEDVVKIFKAGDYCFIYNSDEEFDSALFIFENKETLGFSKPAFHFYLMCKYLQMKTLMTPNLNYHNI